MFERWRGRFHEIDLLLDAVLELPSNERVAFVETKCAGDEALRREVLSLIDLVSSSQGFLEHPAMELAAPLLRELSGSTPPVPQAGPFRVVREIGRGGMGAVYLGERNDGQFAQRVAIKMTRPTASPELVARFMEERRILAMLDHPSIARLVDGGITPNGMPWFAMEYVEGEPIDRYCDTRSLGIGQRLELFASACDAVQYAHRHLVVHRDLKPSNMLVTPEGQLKLLDFGIAKLIDPLIAGEEEEITRATVRAMTPEYAAPEQVRRHAVSTATDVYSLGVLLYALLTGQRPYDLREKTAGEVERIICEVEPPTPSATVNASDPGSEQRARARATTPDRLCRVLRGDLDVVVMQALRKEPARRYLSADDLRDDLERFRDARPIRARADSASYRLGKFVRRRAVPLAVAASVLAILVAGGLRERFLRTRAQAEARKAEQTTDFMFSLFEATENGQALSDTVDAHELLRRGAAQARASNASPELRAQMLDVLGRLEGDLGNYVEARPLLEEALALRRKLYGSDHPDVATSLGDLAAVLGATDDFAAAATLAREELSIRRRLGGKNDVKTTDALFTLAQDLHESGRSREAAPLLAEWEAAVSKAPPELTRTRLRQLERLAEFVLYTGPPQRAESLSRVELSLARQLYGERNDQVAQAIENVGDALDAEGRRADAEPMLRQASNLMAAVYPAGSQSTARSLKRWAVELERLSRFKEAEAPLRAALPMAQRTAGENTTDVLGIEQELSFVLTMLGRYDEALSFGEDQLRQVVKLFGTKSVLYTHAQVFVADAMRGQGKFGEAEPILLGAEARFRNSKGLLNNYWRSTVMALSRLYDAEGQPQKAAKYRVLVSPPAH